MFFFFKYTGNKFWFIFKPNTLSCYDLRNQAHRFTFALDGLQLREINVGAKQTIVLFHRNGRFEPLHLSNEIIDVINAWKEVFLCEINKNNCVSREFLCTPIYSFNYSA